MIWLHLVLKWLTFALFFLALFSALTALYIYYDLHYGSCQTPSDQCVTHLATLYASGIGVVGFSVSGLAALVIKRGFEASDRDD